MLEKKNFISFINIPSNFRFQEEMPSVQKAILRESKRLENVEKKILQQFI